MQNKTMLASILFSLIGFVSMAQGPTPPPPTPPPPGLPIDGAMFLAFSVALVFGIYSALRVVKDSDSLS